MSPSRATSYYDRAGLNSTEQFPFTAALHVAVGDGGGAPQHRPTERRAGTSTRTERSHPTGCYSDHSPLTRLEAMAKAKKKGATPPRRW